jgi:hypothetical protein
MKSPKHSAVGSSETMPLRQRQLLTVERAQHGPSAFSPEIERKEMTCRHAQTSL